MFKGSFKLPFGGVELLEKVKLMLGIKANDTSCDDVLSLMLEDATTSVLNYCRLKKLPKELEVVVREIVINKYKNIEMDNVESVKRGDTEVTYSEAIGIKDFTDVQKASLNRFRRFIMR